MKLQKNIIKSLSLILFVLIVAISCDKRPTAPNLLVGTWENPTCAGEIYTYDGITFTSAYDGKNSYVVNVERIIYSSDTAGIIYGKYTENSYIPSLVGKYYAVSFKDLTDSGVSISGAYKKSGKTGTDTLIEAISEFTEDNGYFGIYSACERKQ